MALRREQRSQWMCHEKIDDFINRLDARLSKRPNRAQAERIFLRS